MVNANTDAMGILFPNAFDKLVPELVSERLMASVPFASRYRLIDFMLSSMVNCGIGNVAILVREKYHSLMDHLGSGREWDLSRKNGGLNIFPPYAESTMRVYGGRIEALASILGFLKAQKEKYVIMSDTNFAATFDFNEMLDKHVASGADLTIVYAKEALPLKALGAYDFKRVLYYTLDLFGDHVTKMTLNSKEEGIQNFSLNMYIIEREKLIDMIQDASIAGGVYFERDILMPKISEMKVMGYEYTGYLARINDMKSYFDENMRLLDDDNLDALFGKTPVYTKIRDDNPTRYIGDAKAINVMAADGCVIEGEVENSILFRGVKIGKGASVKNCVLMQDTVVGENAVIENLITDKQVIISAGKEMKGADTFPVYISKGQTV